MSLALHGVGVSRGVAIGKTHVLARDSLRIIEHRLAEQELDRELERFDAAIAAARAQLAYVRRQIPASTPLDVTSLIDTHLLMLDDAAFCEVPKDIVRIRRCNAEWALKLQRDALVRAFDEMDDAYLRTRRDDVDYVVDGIQRVLLDEARITGEPASLAGAIVLADNLSPAETLLMQHRGIAGFVTERGGANSHTAILARSLGIPALVGVHEACRYVRSGELVIADGWNGVLFAGVDDDVVGFFRARQGEEQQNQQALAVLADAPAVTRDGQRVALMANIELLEDLLAMERVGAEGIGLFRTELLFMNREEAPGEEEQVEVYRRAIEAVGAGTVTIRTLDIGADKELPWADLDTGDTANPALSLRGIRWCLRESAVFRTQLRAILRASAYGGVAMMLPMLTNVAEVRQVRQLLSEVMHELEQEGVPFNPRVPLGGMIEVPAAALIADVFARYLDFLSIGTNDLIQYTVAADRVDDSVGHLYDPLHPAVLRLIHTTIAAGRRESIPVAMCGEMAGDVRYTRLLLGLGLRKFSMHPAVLLEVKHIINATDAQSVGQRLRIILERGDGQELRDFVYSLAAS